MNGYGDSFGIPNVSQFKPPETLMVNERPDPAEDNGKGAGGILGGIVSPLLGLAGMVPGPQQPFVLGAAALTGATGKALQGDISGSAKSLSQVMGAAGIEDLLKTSGSLMPDIGPSLTKQGADILTGAKANLNNPYLSLAPKPDMEAFSPSFNGYQYQYNPYQFYGTSIMNKS